MEMFGILMELHLPDALGQVLAPLDHRAVQELALQLLCHVEDLLESWENLLEILVFGDGNHRNRILLLKNDSSSHLGK